jgi:hypothetical protein
MWRTPWRAPAAKARPAENGTKSAPQSDAPSQIAEKPGEKKAP